jgi:hypothetical protein
MTTFVPADLTGLYAVARRLQDDGLVQKSGVALHPTAKAKQNNPARVAVSRAVALAAESPPGIALAPRER